MPISTDRFSIEGEPIASIRVILCEGSGDKSLFEELIAVRKLPDFYVTHPVQEIHPGGREGFEKRLRSLKLQPGFDAVTGIIVVSDNNSNPSASFDAVRKHIHDAECDSPNHPYVVKAGTPAVAVVMLPNDGVKGQLETLCLEAVKTAWPHEFQCAEKFGECMGIAPWSQSKQEKARLRALISHICKKDPNSSLTHLWGENRELVVPVDHKCFNHLADFLSRFDRLVAEAQ
ncbi:MAG: DUF3226 domain-containing protein [Desulfomonilaceae bacterium]